MKKEKEEEAGMIKEAKEKMRKRLKKREINEEKKGR